MHSKLICKHFDSDFHYAGLHHLEVLCSAGRKVYDSSLVVGRQTVVDADNHAFVVGKVGHTYSCTEGQMKVRSCQGLSVENFAAAGAPTMKFHSVVRSKPFFCRENLQSSRSGRCGRRWCRARGFRLWRGYR
jgi:hypothetical protein